ncbi:GNAT family N-acetyltransferase [Bacillus sp. DTU_2020_1000418_1_SI_GHA_SEK_038]|uniref:GNAT family N-acetyltransferase n=1 Tax=Bacillus sp. DTU_2020_1000418_1_SI_GHA_SEK_038 TaxID=3077585 RepID=UPI0028E52780|nr:GNAT family N-acetyltransferase [Bacillus sp. DTU_2020_1000418_1_SI_GHA_SEK_038]WNS76406.1 GNAT family N-acetyltransferase [Bacillus sp. DTU_2020_1000418_1_SI_GHA_SEK_038]
MHIYEGTLIKDGGTIPFVVQPLTMADLGRILEVQEKVVSHLNGKTTLQPLTEEEFQYILEGNGMMIGAFVGGELIAFRALLVPVMDEEHLGLDIGLGESELPKVIYQEISNVLPDYRGNQLQKTLAGLIMKELSKNDHGYRYVCCTVAPFNIPSLKDKFSQGMMIAALKEKYGGSLRYIFVKDLGETIELDWSESLFIPMVDTAAQQSKLAEGWRGIRMEDRNRELWVEYKR